MHLKLINLKIVLKIKWKHLNFQGNEWYGVMRNAEPLETKPKTSNRKFLLFLCSWDRKLNVPLSYTKSNYVL